MTLIANPPLYATRGHVRTVDPAAEPVTAAELRDYLRETATGLPDADANDLIAEAREMLEEATGLALITQTWRLSLDDWPRSAGNEPWWDGVRQMAISQLAAYSRVVTLPRYPLASVSSVMTYDEASNSTAVSVASVFDVDTYTRPGRLSLKSSQSWPVARRPVNAIEVVYVAGYGADGDAVPAALKRAVKQMAAYLYSHRGDGCEPGDVLKAAGSTLSTYAVARL